VQITRCCLQFNRHLCHVCSWNVMQLCSYAVLQLCSYVCLCLVC